MNNVKLTPRGELVLDIATAFLLILSGWLVMRGMAFMFVTVGDELIQAWSIIRTAVADLVDLFM